MITKGIYPCWTAKLQGPKYTKDGRQTGWWTIDYIEGERPFDLDEKIAEWEQNKKYSWRVVVRKKLK